VPQQADRAKDQQQQQADHDSGQNGHHQQPRAIAGNAATQQRRHRLHQLEHQQAGQQRRQQMEIDDQQQGHGHQQVARMADHGRRLAQGRWGQIHAGRNRGGERAVCQSLRRKPSPGVFFDRESGTRPDSPLA
jgi:hypothetical protein